MSRYMEAINVLYKLKKESWHRLLNNEREAIDQVLAIRESEAEIAIRECDEMLEEASRMANG